KGASSMVGLSGLSHIACQLEETVEGLAAGQLPLNEDTERLLLTTLQLIESYLDGTASGAPRDESLLAEASRAHRQLRGLPEGDPPPPPARAEGAASAPVALNGLPEPPSFLADLPEPGAFDSPPDPAAPDLPLPEPPAEPQEVSGELLEVFTLE